MVNLLATLSQRLRRTDEKVHENEVSRVQEWEPTDTTGDVPDNGDELCVPRNPVKMFLDRLRLS